MSQAIYLLNICPMCQATAVGFEIVPISKPIRDTKCAFCKKKKECETCRVKAIKEAPND